MNKTTILILFLFMSPLYLSAKKPLHFPTYRAGGQVVLDGGWFFDRDSTKTDHKIRRARVYLRGDLQEDISYEMEYDFTSSTPYKDIYVKYTRNDFDTTVKIGNIKEPIGLDALTGSKYNSFMERALPDIFIFDRKVGVTVSKNEYLKKRYSWGIETGIFLKPIDKISDNSNRYSLAIRAYRASFFKKKSLWHLGLSGAYSRYDDKKLKLSIGPESHLSDIKYLKTKIKHTKEVFRYALESIWQNGSFTAQAEYIYENVKTTSSHKYGFYGWYAQISHFTGGERKRYKRKGGVFARVKLKKPLSKNSLGVLESAFRISYVDLDDSDKRGGEVYQYTVALNWYIKNNLRIMMNHITINPVNNGDDYDPKILQLRIQYDF